MGQKDATQQTKSDIPGNRIVDLLSRSDVYRFQALLYEVDRLQMPKGVFSGYTDHRREHAERLVSILDQGIPDASKEQLSSAEAFVLLTSAHLHDIGYTTCYADHISHSLRVAHLGERILNAVSDYPTPKGMPEVDAALMDHGVISARLLLDTHRRLGLAPDEADIVARICRAHTRVDHIDDLPSYSTIRQGRIRGRLLASILRFADNLEVAAPRASALAALLVIADELQDWGRPAFHGVTKRLESEALKKTKWVSPIDLKFMPREGIVLLECHRAGRTELQLLKYVADTGTAHLSAMKKDFRRITFPYKWVQYESRRGRVG